MEQMQAQAEHVGTRIVTDLVTSVDLAAGRSGWSAIPARSSSPSR